LHKIHLQNNQIQLEYKNHYQIIIISRVKYYCKNIKFRNENESFKPS